GAEIAEEGVAGKVLAPGEIHEAEPARIVVDDTAFAARRVQMEDDMVVARVLAARHLENTRRLAIGRGTLHPEGSGHAEMSDHHVAALDIDQKILGAAPERHDLAAGQRFGEGRRKGKTQVRAAQFRAADTRSLHDGRKTALDRFHFRQFRHVRLLEGDLTLSAFAAAGHFPIGNLCPIYPAHRCSAWCSDSAPDTNSLWSWRQ